MKSSGLSGTGPSTQTFEHKSYCKKVNIYFIPLNTSEGLILLCFAALIGESAFEEDKSDRPHPWKRIISGLYKIEKTMMKKMFHF